MLYYLVLFFVVVPIVELTLLLQVHHALAAEWDSFTAWLITVGSIIVTGVLGAALAKQQGLGVFRDLTGRLARGQLPGQPLVDGVLILIGAALLLTPGFLTDLVGFSLLIPVTRAGYRSWLSRRFRRKFESGVWKVTTTHHGEPVENTDNVIDATASPTADSQSVNDDT